jgi:virulence-associated protein VagC
LLKCRAKKLGQTGHGCLSRFREVAILRDSARRIVVPADSVWDDFFESPGIDIGEREQPPVQVREAF